MNKCNEMDKESYLVDHVLTSIFTGIVYQSIIFRNLKNVNYITSLIYFWMLLIFLLSVGIAITNENRRTRINVYLNIIMPIGIYTILTYLNTIFELIVICGIISVLLIIAIISVLLFRKIKFTANRNKVICKRIIRVFFGTRIIIGGFFLVIISYLSITNVFLGGIFYANQDITVSNIEGEYTIDSHIDVVSKMDEEIWCTLSSEEKVNTLQIIANIEAYELGIPHEINVKISKLPHDVAGSYIDRTHTVAIDIEIFESEQASYILDTLCHEIYHAYQFQVIEAYESVADDYKNLLLFQNAQKYKIEFSNYIDTNGDREMYYSQDCETDATNYAKGKVLQYYMIINEYIRSK